MLIKLINAKDESLQLIKREASVTIHTLKLEIQKFHPGLEVSHLAIRTSKVMPFKNVTAFDMSSLWQLQCVGESVEVKYLVETPQLKQVKTVFVPQTSVVKYGSEEFQAPKLSSKAEMQSLFSEEDIEAFENTHIPVKAHSTPSCQTTFMKKKIPLTSVSEEVSEVECDISSQAQTLPVKSFSTHSSPAIFSRARMQSKRSSTEEENSSYAFRL